GRSAPLGGTGNPTLANAFRVGVDGNNAPIPAAAPTLPQPTFPGFNAVASGAGSALDPHFRPNVVDSFDLTIQRQISSKFLLEVGYIGRRITKEFQQININAVPHMMTVGGQSFANAYAAVETAMGCATSFAACSAATKATTTVAPQAFFEAAMNPAYCAGFASCTAAVVAKEFKNFQTQSVWSLWSHLDNGGFNFPRSMLNTAIDCVTGKKKSCGGPMSSRAGVYASIWHGNYKTPLA